MEPKEPPRSSDRMPSAQQYMHTPAQYVDSLPPSAHSKLKKTPKHAPQVPRPRRRPWARLAMGIALIVLLLLVAYAAYLVTIVVGISTQPLQFASLAADSSGRVNVLVLGVGDPGHAGEQLSDTMMVLSLDTNSNKIAQISVPRDLRVNVPGYGMTKINAANADGGAPLAEQTVSNTLGIPINYYLQTDFTGLSNMVNAVGGLDVNVKQRLFDPEYPCADNQYKSCGVDIQPGLQHMDGARVLQYVRCRKGTCGNDFGRAARQQEVISLIRQKVVSWNLLLNSTQLTKVVSALRTGMQTDMGAVEAAEFARDWQTAQKNQPIGLVLSTSPGGYLRDAPDGSSDLVPIDGDLSAIQARIQNIFSSN